MTFVAITIAVRAALSPLLLIAGCVVSRGCLMREDFPRLYIGLNLIGAGMICGISALWDAYS